MDRLLTFRPLTAIGLSALAALMLNAVTGAAAVELSSARSAGPPAGDQSSEASGKLAPAVIDRFLEQPGPLAVWVFLTDKGVQSPAALSDSLRQLETTYNSRAVQRRLLRGSPAKRAGRIFDFHDLPVVPEYVAAVRSAATRVRVVSRWLNAVSVEAGPDQLAQVAALPFVRRIQPVARARRIEPMGVERAGPVGTKDRDLQPGRPDYGRSAAQLAQINLIALHEAGFTGQGVIVGILDTGFHRTHVAFNNPERPLAVVAEYDFVNGDPNTEAEPGDYWWQHYHGTWILGTLAAYLPGELVGGAYDASFILCKTEDTTAEYPAEEDYYVAGLEFIESNGGDLATSSLGYIDWYTQSDLDGQTAVTTLAVNIATANGLHCCTAAGNEGHDADPLTSHLIAPADAFQVITCGAVRASGAITSFSSDGPTADGRVKPEVLARGYRTATVAPDDDQDYDTVDGTSLSTPLVAGAVACLVQAHPDWTVDQMRMALCYTAGDFVTSGTYDPLYVRGYGIINAFAAANPPDCNGNGVSDWSDIAEGTSQDCNGNAIPDECDLAGGTSSDCNANAIPDECDLSSGYSQDCNLNDLPDECEIAAGTVPDCNSNGVPDQCDLDYGYSPDCQPNGMPDECDIAAGLSLDCTANGFPDECELDCDGNGVADSCDIAAGTARDCNHNQMPDQCDISLGISLDEDGDGIPDECELCTGDLNGDRQVDFRDVNPFVQYLVDHTAWQAAYPDCDPRNGDINGDGTYPSPRDVNPFVMLLVGNSLPIGCP